MCRHTFASQMLGSGATDAKQVYERMGHTSDAMLRKHYVKVFESQEDNSVIDSANKALGFEQ